MHQYRTQQDSIQQGKELEKIICNKCGKEIIVKNGMMEEEVLSVQKRWGYFSNKDNEVHEFDLCETCYDQLTALFLFPVDSKQI